MEINAMDFSNPERECDLVMKGGITSGIVYPQIVLKLASEGKYRFRNVGGTSAGAIAAAVMAAAEYGRETGGFHRFYEMSQQLTEPGFLFNLFQPSPHLKPLMYTLLEVMGKISPEDGLDYSPSSSSLPPSQPQKTNQENAQNAAVDAKSKFQPIPTARRLVKILKRRHPSVAWEGGRRGLGIGLLAALVLTAIASGVFYSVAAFTAVNLSFWAAILLFVILGVLFSWVGYPLGILFFGARDLIQTITQDVPQNNFFGVCTGRKDSSESSEIDKTILTDWLSSEIDRIAMVDHPLTFGDLKAKQVTLPNTPDPLKVGITLNMVTSNLSQNQPYTLPFEDGHLLLFNKQEFIKLFPPNVVKHLIDNGGKQRTFTYGGKQHSFNIKPDSSFYFLPNGNHLPVVVAMRMSLSFPLLISAVPLYTIKQSAMVKRINSSDGVYTLNEQHDLQKNWFSDGGIASNFPIHFFDSWLPTRPTFGVNLASVSEDALIKQPGDHKQISPENLTVTPEALSTEQSLNQKTKTKREDVYLPRIGETPAAEWVDIKDSLLTFLSQIFATSQNYRDTMQSRLPGYRERIVQVRLTATEGGLNLAMPRNTIEAVMQKGEEAGEVLCADFNFDAHKWVRLRVLLGLLDEKLRDTYVKALENDKFGAQQLVDEVQARGFSFEYESPEAAEKAKDAVRRIGESAEAVWNREPSLSGSNSPKPKTVLRTTPEF
jgi:predicted acylesterase/phospholipase RssA